ncbi:peptide/nickel transport system ATP-binding protein [Halobiforma haloterrestris]|uniref:Peptide/nickel transport system ATP-binding protein n=1 Tax=Natronobacterium haloterrestre TaxID=148448 RepID=A0A1I1DK24_NATHA|nr:oligopeptide/dipeptide ABC transporter ATP-binding protein [Halobiforma haloterrestris]SFB75261.1 peptide/nickel transport system ATP-binding protein [Halobiforma haloterrestris]
MSERIGGADERSDPLLEVEDLETHFPITRGFLRREVGRVRAVDGVSFRIDRGETFGLVGESGSGKTTTALSALRLEEPTGGEIRFDGESVTDLSGADLRAFRRRAQLIVQDPNDAFNPRMTVGEAVAEPLALHGMNDAERRRRIVADLLERVGLAADDADRYPHEFSGGEKQRIAIARALVLNPDLIVADEPTSALDGRVQSDVLALLDDVRREFDVAVLFISHDIDVVRQFCDRLAVMYLGEIVERGPTAEVLNDPAHPYTRVLLGSVPSLDPSDRELARPLTDSVPEPSDPPAGCRFHPRCPDVIAPADVDLEPDLWRTVAAFRFSVRTGELPPEIDAARGTEDPEPGIDETTVREAFDLPGELPDDRAEEGVAAAAEAIARGDLDAATDTLAEAFPTVCGRESPADGDRHERQVRCHRYDSAVEATPRSSSRTLETDG